MSKLGPHLGRILLKRSLLSHCKAFDLEVRIARFRLWKHCLCFFAGPGTGCEAPVLAFYCFFAGPGTGQWPRGPGTGFLCFFAGPSTGCEAPVLALAAATWLVDCNVHLQTILCDKIGVLNLDQRCINYVDPSKSMVLV